MRLLLVEDEPDLRAAVTQYLTEDGFAVDGAEDGESALWRIAGTPYDAVVLDLMLPKVDGMRVLRRVRRDGNAVPVIVLTARDAVDDRVAALNAGADDYLVKPFAMAELAARLRSLIRRAAQTVDPTVEIGEIRVDLGARTIKRDGKPVDVTAREYAVLELLLHNRGRVVTRTAIHEHIYDESDPTMSNVLDVYVANLRRKLGRSVIQTRRGQGYVVP
jgi:two-component system OmpR family response regulator